ncbi:MAG TPA: hypothetical protein VHE35_08090 [Kofleriaceae bacterium]|nr:hypothetical protein [Kofleriaceae bacterium]
MRTRTVLLSIATCAAGAAGACGPNAGGGDDDVAIDARTVDARPADAAPGDTNDELPSLVYAHAGKTLYRIDTHTLDQVLVGDFTNLGTQTMLDIAVDHDGKMIGITRDKIFTVDPNTAESTLLATFVGASNFTSLSFVPADAANPDGPEVLLSANDAGAVYRIDVAGGTATAVQVGSYGTQGGTAIGSSGDIVSVRGFGTMATVDVGPGRDYLARLDPANGWKATIIGTGTGFDNIFGLGFWAGKLYGFVDDGFAANTGAMIEIDPVSGAGTLVRAGAIRWFGAGVTTIAPIIP